MRCWMSGVEVIIGWLWTWVACGLIANTHVRPWAGSV
jgi:hypothetical protein